ncbi:MAG: peptidylprolyl isomerase, partial [Okeania sp. SIO2D1]|nr:peptidylprolyl isomerase [Okeania sp. SIO2D1]
QASRIISSSQEAILAGIPEQSQPQAEKLLAQIAQKIDNLREAVEAEDRENTWNSRREILDQITQIEDLMVQGFPFEVPSDYANLPQLKGRATVEIETEQGNLTVIVDGYNAPVTAGNFVDLVHRGFYDGLEFTRAEGNYVLQTGDPSGPDQGFIDPGTGEYRAIPLEIMVQSEPEPIYGFTLEEIGLYREQPVLPFSAYGTLGMARPGFDANGGSSQFFFFLFEPELTPAGLNLLDGRYTVFGYTVAGQDILGKLKAGDKIVSAHVVKGLEHLVEPQ